MNKDGYMTMIIVAALVFVSIVFAVKHDREKKEFERVCAYNDSCSHANYIKRLRSQKKNVKSVDHVDALQELHRFNQEAVKESNSRYYRSSSSYDELESQVSDLEEENEELRREIEELSNK